MTKFYLHLIYRDGVPIRYLIRTHRAEFNGRGRQRTELVDVFDTPQAAYDAADAGPKVASMRTIDGSPVVYQETADFPKRMFDRDGWTGPR
jgi:hypothetical protein